MIDTSHAEEVARTLGLDYDAQTLEIFAYLLAIPRDVIRAMNAATTAAPAFTDSYESRYEAAYAELHRDEAAVRHDLASRVAETGAWLAIGRANIERQQEGDRR